MTGKTHKAIGIAMGVAITLYAARSGNAIYALGMISAPVGAMLPDIDHDHSKLGSERKALLQILKKIAGICSILFVAVFLIWSYLHATIVSAVLSLLLAFVPLAAILIILNTPQLKNKTKFFTKHRGIMHTLLVPVSMLLGAFFVPGDSVKALLFGIMFGYLSHLLADCCTKRGCPILYPITEKCIRFLPVRTGSMWEYIIGAVLSGGIVWIGIFLSW